MDKKKSEFDKVFSAWDILVIAFGAMIGWGWVVSSVTGSRGAACWEHDRLCSRRRDDLFRWPDLCGIDRCHAPVWWGTCLQLQGNGTIGSFICTWAIVLGYVSVVCFEACALPTIITYIYPGF